MKELLKQLGFEHPPMLTEFIKAYKEALGLELLLTDARSDAFQAIDKYSDFITQPLTKGMFIPVDEYGNMLEKPAVMEDDADVWEEYNNAVKRILFDLDKCTRCPEVRNTIEDGFIVKFTMEQAINSGRRLILK